MNPTQRTAQQVITETISVKTLPCTSTDIDKLQRRTLDRKLEPNKWVVRDFSRVNNHYRWRPIRSSTIVPFIHSVVHFGHAQLGVCSAKHRHQSPEWTDDSELCQLLHSGRGYWISGLAGFVFSFFVVCLFFNLSSLLYFPACTNVYSLIVLMCR